MYYSGLCWPSDIIIKPRKKQRISKAPTFREIQAEHAAQLAEGSCSTIAGTADHSGIDDDELPALESEPDSFNFTYKTIKIGDYGYVRMADGTVVYGRYV